MSELRRLERQAQTKERTSIIAPNLILSMNQMSGVIIEELDNSSEESFGTPKSSHSADEFHEPAESFQDKPGKSGNASLAIYPSELI